MANDPDAVPETRFRPRRPLYRIRPHDTLRSIARDTLGESRRADDILDLNRDLIKDPNALTPGQTIEPTALVHEAYLRLVGDTPDRR